MQKLSSVLKTGLGQTGTGMNWAKGMALRCRAPAPQHLLFERSNGENDASGETRTILIAQKYIIKSTISYI